MDRAREDINYDIAHSIGIIGKGVGVAVLDAGAYPHEDSRDRVAALADYVNQRLQPYDDNGYETCISVMIGGSDVSSEGKYRGIAPGYSLVSVKALDHKGGGCTSDVLAELK